MAINIGLVGYFGWGNYGDELFYKILNSTFNECRTVSLIDHSTGLLLKDIESILQDIDAVIIGGGDLLIPWGETPYFNRILLKKPVFIIGIGVPLWGPADSAAINHYGEFLRDGNVKCVICRDKESSEWVVKTFGVQTDVAPDLVLAADFPPYARHQNRVGFIVRDQKNIDMANVANLGTYIDNLGYELFPIVLGTNATLRDDIESYAEILDAARPCVCNNTDTITRAIGSCKFVVSMKFHGIVAAYSMKIPFMALSGANKFSSFCAYTNNQEAYIPFDIPMERKFDVLIESRFDFSRLGSLKKQSLNVLKNLKNDVLSSISSS